MDDRSPYPTFSLASLMLVMTLTAITLSTFTWSRPAGIALVILLVPAFIRTVQIRSRQKAAGLAVSFGQRIAIFAQSLGVVALIAGASAGTLMGIGWLAYKTGGPSDVTLIAGAILAVGASGTVGLVLILWLWTPRG
jgi:hypothetical protein